MAASEHVTSAGQEGESGFYPWWVFFTLFTLDGAFAGWCGPGLLNWTPALLLLGATIVVTCINVFFEILWKLREVRQLSLRVVLIATVIYGPLGLLGGLCVGVLLIALAWGIGDSVDWIADENVRLAAGTIIGMVIGCAAVRRVSRLRRSAVQAEPNQVRSYKTASV
jgi:hypothetical protein